LLTDRKFIELENKQVHNHLLNNISPYEPDALPLGSKDPRFQEGKAVFRNPKVGHSWRVTVRYQQADRWFLKGQKPTLRAIEGRSPMGSVGTNGNADIRG
jgi:hypothetical protein